MAKGKESATMGICSPFEISTGKCAFRLRCLRYNRYIVFGAHL